MDDINGVNEFTAAELDQLFSDEFEQTTPPATENTDGQNSENTTDKKESIDTTKAFAKRLKESTDKARQEERDAIAKSLGYESYADLQKKQENKYYEDKGLDPDQVSPIVEELIKKRLNEDPRMKELETLRKQQIEEFGKRELAEITKLTNGEITSLAQLPKEVIDLFKKEGSLKSAYMKLEGEKLINKIRGEQSKGTTVHMQSPTGSAPQPSNKRPLTDDEKAVWMLFNPKTSKEELDKKMYDIK